jgi:hypothetical protein
MTLLSSIASTHLIIERRSLRGVISGSSSSTLALIGEDTVMVIERFEFKLKHT